MELRAETSMLDDDALYADMQNSQATADSSYALAYNINQYYWFNETGEDTGAHISFLTKDVFKDLQSGYNLLLAADAVALRYGMLPLTVWDTDSLDFYQVDTTTNTSTPIATFGATTQIGAYSGDTHSYIQLDSSGLSAYKDSILVATFGENACIGNDTGFHIRIIADTDNGEVAFWAGAETQTGNKVAYISGQELYITQTIVLNQVSIGNTVASGGAGQWAWRVHEINGQNNLYLKWLG